MIKRQGITAYLYTISTTLILLLHTGDIRADEIRVAVASNFTYAIKHIAKRFEANSDHRVTLVLGSTGKHYAQIINGAPFHLFFAADSHRPALLEKEGTAIAGSRFTYAFGKLILWSPDSSTVDVQGDVLSSQSFRHLAIANPKLAPYGRAAREVLLAKGLWDSLQGRMVRGENIGQTYQFVTSSSAELGFIALSQVKRPDEEITGSFWNIPTSLYTPIEQQAVLLTDKVAAREFINFIQSPESLAIINSFGYSTP